MKPLATIKTALLCATVVAFGFATTSTAIAAEGSDTTVNQWVNTAAKTDRLADVGVVPVAVATEKTDGRHQSRKTDVGFTAEPSNAHGAAPSDNEKPKVVAEPATQPVATTRNFSEAPEERDPSLSPVWTYSRGLLERTEGRAKYLWNQWLNRK